MFKWVVLLLLIHRVDYTLSMVNGSVVDITRRPYQASLIVDYWNNLRGKHVCGGTIISEKHVLTAAHCIRSKINDYIVRIGSSDCTTGGILHDIEKVVIHPNFTVTKQSMTYDVAILVMYTNITFHETVQSIALAKKSHAPFSHLTVGVSGYGRTCFTCANGEVLTHVLMDTMTTDHCLMYETEVLPNEVCLIDSKRNSTSCVGDSGGPVTLSTSRGEFLLGIVSHGDDCRADRACIFALMPEYAKWIRNVTGMDL